MAVKRETGVPASTGGQGIFVARRLTWGRLATLISLGFVALLLLAIAIVWIERRPIAGHYLKGEFERRGVTASYHLERVGFRTQEVSNLVIGDPKRPDLVAKHALIQMRPRLNGSIEVYRIVARGVRLRGQLVGGKVHWGQIDKMLPPPSDKPFKLPNLTLDIADSTISLKTPFGPVGIAIAGNGNLSGGFKGRVALTSARLVPGRCTVQNLRVNAAVAVVGRRPNIAGPVILGHFACPSSRTLVEAPRLDVRTSFNESFTRVDGTARMAIPSLVAGANGLANIGGNLSFKGPLSDVRGRVQLSSQRSRLATIFADRTRLDAAYGLSIATGRLALVGKVAANSAKLDPAMLAGVIQPLDAAAASPIGPVAKAMVAAVRRTTGNFDLLGSIRLVNFSGGGAARINDARIAGPQGARAHVFGGSGVTYYWPSSLMRIDGNIETAGGGLPAARVKLSQPGPGRPMSGVAEIAPYSVNGSRLALAPVRFRPEGSDFTRITTIAQLDGPFRDGRVRALRLPIDGRVGRGGSFAFGTSCGVLSFDYAQFGALQLDRTRLPVCPNGRAIVSKQSGGAVVADARVNATVLDGRLGKSPFHLQAAGGRFTGQRFALDRVQSQLGRSEAPIRFDAARVGGSFGGRGISGDFSGARATIGNVPTLLSEAAGKWKVYHGDISVDSSATVSDRFPNPRFTPLRSNDLHLTIARDFVRANGSLRHPASGTRVMDVAIEHRLSNGSGHADLNVPSLVFGPGFEPDDLTRFSQGVVALVKGTVSGTGRIDWNNRGKVTSSGDFSTAGLDLAAPFGPVEGISGTIHFNDLLGLTTAPGQTLAIKGINPGILVENGAIRYQLLPGQLVKVERGEWPFMGGTLVLQETVLNFARPTAKRLSFEVVGLDAHTFVSSLGFKEIDATGRFDGVLPMIFDENGGRIVGGRLDSRGDGSLLYNGVVTKADLGTMGNIAFNALKDLRFHSMIIRLDGDLAGEFGARLTVDGVALGQSNSTQKLIRGLLAKIPLHLNVNITGPFRALVGTAKSFNDPRRVIGDVLPFPLDDVPGIATEVRRVEENQQQTQTPVVGQEIAAPPPKPAER